MKSRVIYAIYEIYGAGKLGSEYPSIAVSPGYADRQDNQLMQHPSDDGPQLTVRRRILTGDSHEPYSSARRPNFRTL